MRGFRGGGGGGGGGGQGVKTPMEKHKLYGILYGISNWTTPGKKLDIPPPGKMLDPLEPWKIINFFEKTIGLL